MSISIPPNFQCPITSDLMNDPVIDPDGNSFERSAIIEWLKIDLTSPLTRKPLRPEQLISNKALQEAIQEYCAKHPPAQSPLQSLPSVFGDASAVAAAPGGPLVSHKNDLRLVTTFHAASSSLHVTLNAPSVGQRPPSDVVCVIDVSGSMQQVVDIRDANGHSTEQFRLSRLDLVKHAMTTIIHTLGPLDRLAVVSFSNTASVVFDLLPMTEQGKATALVAIKRLRPQQMTNLWDGVLRGMNLLKQAVEQRNAAVLVLTDGEPNMEPPRGYVPSLQQFLATAGSAFRAPIHTFGFGYQLDSTLLDQLATVGNNGSFAFCPDGGFVGTVFVHALSRLLTTAAYQTEVQLELPNGWVFAASQNGASSGGLSVEPLDGQNRAHLLVGPVGYGSTSRTLVLPVVQSSDDAVHVLPLSEVKALLSYRCSVTGTPSIHPSVEAAEAVIVAADADADAGAEAEADASLAVMIGEQSHDASSAPVVPLVLSGEEKEEDMVMVENPPDASSLSSASRSDDSATTTQEVYLRHRLVQLLLEHTVNVQKSLHPNAFSAHTLSPADQLKTAADCFRAFLEVECQPHVASSPFVRALTEDVRGQVAEAFSKQEWFMRWGRHYLLSLARAHQVQACINFKDPGMQLYVSPAFAQMRDYVDSLFCNLAPPVPEKYDAGAASASSFGGGAGGSPARAHFSMSSYSCASSGCVSGDSLVTMADGTMLLASEVRAGQVVLATNADGSQMRARIRYVLRTNLTLDERKHVFFYRIEKLRITAWHPVRMSTTDWHFPAMMKRANKEVDAAMTDDAMFSFALDSSAVGMQIGGVDVLSLGHGMTDDFVAKHAYFGTELILADLEQLDQEQNKDGVITVTPSFFQRSKVDGQVNGIRAP